ncbi:MAG: hypothetical protein WC346_02290 [Methanogenium sp.]|jgi:hypothetical protein
MQENKPTSEIKGRTIYHSAFSNIFINKFNSLLGKYNIKPIPKNWRASTTFSPATPKRGNWNGLCYQNSLDYVRSHPGTYLAIGYHIDKAVAKRVMKDNSEYLDVTKHAWVLDNEGRVIDITFGRESPGVYIGKAIPSNNLKDGADVRSRF